MRRSAFTLTEVLIALAIVASALIPIVTFTSSTMKKAAFSEYHVFFQVRAVRLVEHYSIHRYDRLKELATGTDGAIEVTLEDPPIPAEFRRKLKYCTEVLKFREVEPGLGELTAVMKWAFPLDANPDPATAGHEFVLRRLVADPTLSLKARTELRL